MAEGSQTENQSRGNFISRLIHRSEPQVTTMPSVAISTERALPVSDYEKELFRFGVMKFDLKKFTKETGDELRQTQEWRKANLLEGMEEAIAREKDRAKAEIRWRYQFDGKVPATWTNWINISKAFEEAGPDTPLSQTLVDAGVSYPSANVAESVAQSQRLSRNQLAFIMARPDITSARLEHILKYQEKKGVTQEEIRYASGFAAQVKERVENQKEERQPIRTAGLPEPKESV